MSEPIKPAAPTLEQSVVQSLQASMLAMGVLAAQYLVGMRAAAPGILAGMAKALPQALPKERDCDDA